MRETYSILMRWQTIEYLDVYNVTGFFTYYKGEANWIGNGYPQTKCFTIYKGFDSVSRGNGFREVIKEDWHYIIMDGINIVSDKIYCSEEEIETKIRQDIRKYMDNYVEEG